MKVLDTDFLIALLKKEPAISPKMDELMHCGETIATTVLNAQEILVGASISDNPEHNLKATKHLLNSMEVLAYDASSVDYVVRTRSTLAKKGRPIGVMDEMIAGICLANNATIITRNVKHFQQVLSLSIEQW